MRSNRTLQIILILLVALIWAGVFYRIFSVMIKKDIETKKEETLPVFDQTIIREKLNKLKIDFKKESISDPFRPFALDKSTYKQSIKKSPKESPITAPAYLLQGIVWDETNPKAILIKSKIYKDKGKMKIGETIIAEKDTTIDYGKVLDISENYVIITTYNKKFKLRSNLWEKIDRFKQ